MSKHKGHVDPREPTPMVTFKELDRYFWPAQMEEPRQALFSRTVNPRVVLSLETPAASPLVHPSMLGHFYFRVWPEVASYPTIGIATGEKRQAAQRVADTAWLLWADELETMWTLMTDWAALGGLVGETALLMLSDGIQNERIREDDAFSRIEELLLHDEARQQEAGNRLILAISAEHISAATQRWSESDDEKCIERLPRLLERLLQERLFPTLRLFRDWLRGPSNELHKAIKTAISSYGIPEGESESHYRDLVKALTGINLRLGGGRRGPVAAKLQEARNLLSIRRESTSRGKRTRHDRPRGRPPHGKHARTPQRRKR